jgi:hypothetical protein
MSWQWRCSGDRMEDLPRVVRLNEFSGCIASFSWNGADSGPGLETAS